MMRQLIIRLKHMDFENILNKLRVNFIWELIKSQKILSLVILLTITMSLITVMIPGNKNSKLEKDVSKNQYHRNEKSNLINIFRFNNAANPTAEIETENISVKINKTENVASVTPGVFISPSRSQITSPVSRGITPPQQSQPTIIATPGLSPVRQVTPTAGISRGASVSQSTAGKNVSILTTIVPTISATPPKILFIDSGGKQTEYIPPEIPPENITWGRYLNSQEHYAIDYPSNWQIVRTQFSGHEAVFIYRPGDDPSDPTVQYISFGWSTYFYPPPANYKGPFYQDGVLGTIYTNGALGSSFIAGVFEYANGFLVLNNNVSDKTFVYIFDHMVMSLDFNTP